MGSPLAFKEDEEVTTAELRTIASRSDAEKLCAEVEEAMESLIQLVEEETRLVRSGKLFAAGELELMKSLTARRYISAMQEARNAAGLLERYAPVAVDRLRRRHSAFRAMLQINLAVLAAAREVSENLVRGVAENVGMTAAPPVYGRSGVIDARSGRAAAIAVNRSL